MQNCKGSALHKERMWYCSSIQLHKKWITLLPSGYRRKRPWISCLLRSIQFIQNICLSLQFGPLIGWTVFPVCCLLFCGQHVIIHGMHCGMFIKNPGHNKNNFFWQTFIFEPFHLNLKVQLGFLNAQYNTSLAFFSTIMEFHLLPHDVIIFFCAPGHLACRWQQCLF